MFTGTPAIEPMISLIQFYIDVMCILVLGICYFIFRSFEDQISVNMVRCNKALLLSCAFDIMRIISQASGHSTIYFFSLCLLFPSFAIAAAFWMRFCAVQAFLKLPHGFSYRNLLIMAPLFLFVVFCVTDYWHRFMFSVTSDSMLIRNRFFDTLGIACFGYLFTSLLIAGYQFLLGDTSEQRHKGQHLLMFTTGTIMGGLLQYFTNMQWTIACSTVCIVFYIVTVHEDMIFRDQLSGLNTRSRFEIYLSERFEHLHKNPRSYLLFIDIDRFKGINDNYGHLNGDRAIRIVGKIMNLIAQHTGAFVARVGGDEFAALIENGDPGLLSRISELANSYAEIETASAGYEFNLSLSVGCVKVSDADDSISLIELADQEMYRCKARRKARELSDESMDSKGHGLNDRSSASAGDEQ